MKAIETIQYRRTTHNTPCCTILTTYDNGNCRIDAFVSPKKGHIVSGKIVKTMFGMNVYKETINLRVSTLSELFYTATANLYKLNKK